jgi:hypothetical protein
MGKKVYGMDPGGEYSGEARARRMPHKKSHQGYDYVDHRGGEIAKAAARGVGNAIARIVAGPKKK